MSLVNTDIRELQLNEELTNMLKHNLGIYNINHLLITPFKRLFKEIERCFPKDKSEQYKIELRSKVHGANLYFSSEFNGREFIKIDDDTLIEDLNLCISRNTKEALKMLGLLTIRKFVNTDYQKLYDFLGVKDIQLDIAIILARLNACGFHVKNETDSIPEEKVLLKEKGEILLEDIGFKGSLLGLINKYNIYTLRQLLDIGAKLYELPGFGPKIAADIDHFLEAINLKIGDTYPGNDLDHIKSQISDYRTLIAKTSELIEEKERLIKEYESLVKEGDELKAKGYDLEEKILRYAEEIKRGRTKA